MKTGVCKIHVAPCWLQVPARCLPSFVFQGQWNGFSYKMNWFSSFPVLRQIVLHYSFKNLYTRTSSVGFVCQGLYWSSRSILAHGWSWTHICLHLHKTAPSTQLARSLLACPKLNLTITVFILYCDNTKMLLLLITREMYILYFHRKLFWIHHSMKQKQIATLRN